MNARFCAWTARWILFAVALFPLAARAVPPGSNNPPVAVNDSVMVTSAVSTSISVLANDYDPDLDPIFIFTFSGGANGSVFQSGSLLVYQSFPGYCGPDIFTYTVTDGRGGFSTASVFVTVTCGASNQNPVANSDFAVVDSGSSVLVSVLSNDYDPDGDPVVLAGYSFAFYGSVSQSGTQILYQASSVNCSPDQFNYFILDGRGGFATGTVFVTVNCMPSNHPPVAVDDFASAASGLSTYINVLGNDYDPDFDPLTIFSYTPPLHGSVLNSGGLYYQSIGGYSGPDSFGYTITDNRGGYSNAIVNIVVTNSGGGITNPPAAADVSLTKFSGASGNVTVGDPITYTLYAYNAGPNTSTNVIVRDAIPTGTMFVNASGAYTFYPNFQRVDIPVGNLPSGAFATVTVTIQVTNAGPIVNCANAYGDTPDPNTTNNAQCVTNVAVALSADVSMVKSSSLVGNATVGDQITYTLSAYNAGPNTSSNVVVRDAIPSGTVYVSASGGACTYFPNFQRVDCDVGNLAPGSSALVYVTVQVTNAGGIVNFANAYGSTADPNTDNNASGVTNNAVAPSADVSMTKTGPADPIMVGDQITYTLLAYNAGPNISSNVVVRDAIPTGAVYVSASGGACTYFPNFQRVDCDVGNLPPGGSAYVYVTVQITSPGSIVNFANAYGSTADTNTSNNASGVTNNAVAASADVSMTKTGPPGQVTVGDQITYTLQAYNAGPNISSNVVVRDTIPTGTVYVGAIGGACIFYPNFQRVDCDVGDLPLFASAYVYVTVRVTNAGDIVNCANAYGTTADPNTTNNANCITNTAVVPSADVSMSKSSSAFGPVTVGDQITYTLYAYNAGPNISSNVVVRDAIPSGTVYVSASGGACTFFPNFQRVDCDVGNLSPGSSAYVYVTVQVTNAGDIVNFANAFGTTADPNTTNNTSGVTNVANSTPPPQADLDVTKTPDLFNVPVGQLVNYTITVHNNGPDTATNIMVPDVLGPCLTYQSAVVTPPVSFDVQAQKFTIPSLAPGSSVTMGYVARVNSSGLCTNTVSAMSMGSVDPFPNNNTNVALVNGVLPSADLDVTKTPDQSVVAVGQLVNFTITVHNNGPDTATNIMVPEVLGPCFTYQSAIVTPPVSFDVQAQKFTIPSLAPGSSATMVFVAKATCTGLLTNTVSVMAPGFDDSNANNNTNIVVVMATNVPVAIDLSVSKIADLPSQPVGNYAQFFVTVSNLSSVDASNVVVQELLPAGLPFVGSDAPADTFYDDVNGLWYVTNLAANASVTLGVTAEATTIGTFVNQALLQSSAPADTNSNNDTATATVTVYARSADVAVFKGASAGWVRVGDPFTYTVTAFNYGPDLANGVTVSDSMPAGLAFLSANGSQGSIVSSGNLITWDLGYLTVGAYASLDLLVVAQSEQTFDNTATISATEPDPDSTNNTSTVSVMAMVPPFITQDPQSQTVIEGTPVTFDVAAGGSVPLSYQWRFNGTDLAGQTGTSLSIPAANSAHVGLYDVVVTNHAGSVTSVTAYLDVVLRYVVDASAGPNGTVSPSGPNVYLAGAGATFTATPALNHRVDRWLLDGVPVQTGGSTYALLNIQANHSVQVTFVTTDPCQGFAVNFAAGAADALVSGEIAGVLPQDGWVNALGPFGTLTLSNGMTVQWDGASSFLMPPLAGTPDFILMQGGIDSPGAATTINVSGLNFGSTYDVYVYCAGANAGTGETRVGHYTLGGSSKFALDAPSAPDFDGTYTEATSTTGGATASAGNYVVFSGVSGTSFNITAQGDYSSAGALRAPINAIQIIPRNFTTATPISLQAQQMTNGQVRLNITGPAGYPVSLEASTDLANWTPIATLMNTNGTVGYDDSSAAAPYTFYRTVYAGFPTGPDNMAFFGSAPGVAGSSATLILSSNINNPQFAWQSTDPVLGSLGGGFMTASNWLMIPGNAQCPPRIIFRAVNNCTNFSGSIVFGTNGTITVDVQCILSNITRQVRYILNCPVDLDIDSDNNNGLGNPDRSAYEDSIEDDPNRPGKILGVNNGDADADTVPDYADGFNADGMPNTADDTPPNVNFVRVVLELPALINPGIAKVRFTYSASDPAGVMVLNAPTNTTYQIPAGNLRLWKKDGNVFRDKRGAVAGGDFIPTGIQIPAGMLGFSANVRTQVFFLEGIAPGVRPGDQRIVVSVDPGDALITAFCSDAVRATVVRANLSMPNVRDNEKIKRGAVLCLNNDNDDFNVGGTFNFEPDNTQNKVTGDDDLAPLTVQMDFSGLSDGWVKLELVGNAAKVWFQSKSNLLLSPTGLRAASAMPATFALQRTPLFVEGFARSAAVKDTELKLTYRLDPNDPQPLCESRMKLTVVELLLDADLNAALTDDNPRFEPGYGFPGTANAGQPLITTANPEQRLALIAVPISADILDIARFTLNNTTMFPGFAMNQGNVSGPDFSLTTPRSTTQLDINAFPNTRATSDLYCRDYGGSTIARVGLMRGNVALATCEVRIPLDTDRDRLPDFYEIANANDPIRGQQIFDPRDPMTRPFAAAGGQPAVLAMPSDQYDHETQNPVSNGNPANGILGDGLTAFEEYRGFFEVDAAGANPRHRRTSPNHKDVFAFSNVQDINAAMTDMGLGYLLDPVGGASDLGASGVRPHRIDNNQWIGGPTIGGIFSPSRELNFNRAGIPGATRQCAIFADQTLRTGFTDLGVARGGINTGPNGVCNTVVANAGNAALRNDFQVIPRNQGLPNQPSIRPGANGIIDPHMEAGDKLDFSFNPPRIVSATADGALHTLTLPTGVNANGYVADDRVRGNIRGLNGLLNHATVMAINANDVLRGEIREGADNKLENATVLNASANDSLAMVVLDPNGNGFQTVIDPRDILNPNGTVSGGRANGGFFTANIAGNDIFRGKIAEGGDNKLDSRPANANDVVAGTIEEGADNKLDSRPANANDKVIGFVEDGGNGFLDPTLNDAAANIAGSGGVAAPNDDVYDPATRTVMTGPDGIRNTNPQPGADDEPVISAAGNGTPFAYCIDPDNRDNMDGGNIDDQLQTAAAGDDIASNSNDPAGGNSDVNDCAYAYVPITHPLGAPVAPNTANLFDALQTVYQINPPPANRAAPVNFDCRVAAAANDGRRQDLVKQTIGHETGHCMHLEHYFNTSRRQADGTYRLTGMGGHGISGSVIMSGVNDTTPPPAPLRSGVGVLPLSRVFDNVDLQQIRLHQKHP